MTTMSLAFNGNQLTPISHNSQIWLSAVEIAKALGYAREDSVSRIYDRNKDEFTDAMTTVLRERQIDGLGENKGLQVSQRIFTLRGCHLIAMFAKTAIAKDFRKWVLDILDKQVSTQYGLKQLPPSPYISEAETLSLRRHIEAFCKGDQKLYKAMYHKLYKGYNIAKYDQLPAGKLNEALVFLGLNNIQLSPQTEFPEQSIIVMSQAELQAHDEQVASEAVKRVQGELVSEPSQDGVMLFLKNHSEKERRFLVHTKMNAAQITPVADDCYVMTEDEIIRHFADKKGVLMIDKNRLDEITLKQLGKFLA